MAIRKSRLLKYDRALGMASLTAEESLGLALQSQGSPIHSPALRNVLGHGASGSGQARKDEALKEEKYLEAGAAAPRCLGIRSATIGDGTLLVIDPTGTQGFGHVISMPWVVVESA